MGTSQSFCLLSIYYTWRKHVGPHRAHIIVPHEFYRIFRQVPWAASYVFNVNVTLGLQPRLS